MPPELFLLPSQHPDMRDAGFEVGPGNGFEAQRCVKSDEVLLRRDADGLRTPRPGDMPQGFVHQAAAQPAAAVTGVYQHPSDGCLGADDPCGACTMRWYSAAEISLKCLMTMGCMLFVG